MKFTATIEQTGKTTTGIRVPEKIVAGLDQGKRPRVAVIIDDGYSFRTTLGSHEGASFISISAAVREAAGIAAHDRVDVDIERDDAPRLVEVPQDLGAALADNDAARAWFEGLTDSQRRIFVDSVSSAKQPETRRRRVEKAVGALAAAKKRP